MGLKRTPSPPKTRHKIEPHDLGTFRVESRSAHGEHYVVDVSGVRVVIEEYPICPCKGFEIRKICTHVEDCVIELLRKALKKKAAEDESPAAV